MVTLITKVKAIMVILEYMAVIKKPIEDDDIK